MDRIRVFFAGDLMSGRGIDQIMPHPNLPQLHEGYIKDARDYLSLAERYAGPIPRPVSYDYVWGDALAVLARQKPDARIINLETAITTSDTYWRDKGIHYRMHPANAQCLAELGLDCCTLANNHLLDWGYAGIADTLQSLTEHGIASCGAGRDAEQASAPAVLALPDGKRLLVFSFGLPSSGIPFEWAATAEHPGVNLLPDFSTESLSRAVRQIERYRAPDDIVVASIHWGVNWGYAVADEQRRFARGLIDAGVDLVHGHSSHHPIGVELYRRRLICYGCGDFVNDYEGIQGHERFRAHLSLMYGLTMRPDGEAQALTITPMEIRQLRLQHANRDDARWIVRVLNRESRDCGLQFRLNEAVSPPEVGYSLDALFG